MEKENQTNKTFNEPVSMEITRNNRFIIAIQPQGNTTPFVPEWTVKSFHPSNIDQAITIKVLETVDNPIERKICQAIKDKTKFNIIKQLLDPTGVVVATTVYMDATIHWYEETKLDYNDDNVHTYTMGLNYERKSFQEPPTTGSFYDIMNYFRHSFPFEWVDTVDDRLALQCRFANNKGVMLLSPNALSYRQWESLIKTYPEYKDMVKLQLSFVQDDDKIEFEAFRKLNHEEPYEVSDEMNGVYIQEYQFNVDNLTPDDYLTIVQIVKEWDTGNIVVDETYMKERFGDKTVCGDTAIFGGKASFGCAIYRTKNTSYPEYPKQLPELEFSWGLETMTRQIIDTIDNTKAKDLDVKDISAWFFTRDVWGGWFGKFAVAENPNETILVRFLDETDPNKNTYRMNQDYIAKHSLTYKPDACVEFCLQPDDAFHYTDAKIDGRRFVRIELPANDTQRIISSLKDILMYGIPPFPCGCSFGLM